jgi:hypothetical protein
LHVVGNLDDAVVMLASCLWNNLSDATSTQPKMLLCLFDLSTRQFLLQFTVVPAASYSELAQDAVAWRVFLSIIFHFS